MKLDKLKQYKDKKVAILWFWKEWKSSLNFLEKLWFSNISILDKKLEQEKKQWINYVLWENYLDKLSEFDLIIKSPWISPYNSKIAPYKEKLTTQWQIFFDNYNWKIIWITWTKWKSTTSTLAYETLRKIWYNVKIVWNIWNPVLDEIDIINNENYDYIVYELSSYMLEWLNLNLYIWIINNIYNCHLDWHEWKINYTNAKLWVIKNAENKLISYELKDTIKENNLLYYWANWNYSYKEWYFYKNNELILKDENIALEWEHNRRNITAIIWILDIINPNELNKNLEKLKTVLRSFNWLEHRIQNIWTYKWITFIDDAIATTPESTIAAIKTYEQKIWTIFLWWQDSWFEFEELRNILKKYNILNIVLFPETWEKIFWDLSNYNYESEFILDLWDFKPNILKTKSMKSAVDFAFRKTNKWQICILSNASPSFSLWSWYIEKWTQFQNEVKNYN